jgi:hypothetical protein
VCCLSLPDLPELLTFVARAGSTSQTSPHVICWHLNWEPKCSPALAPGVPSGFLWVTWVIWASSPTSSTPAWRGVSKWSMAWYPGSVLVLLLLRWHRVTGLPYFCCPPICSWVRKASLIPVVTIVTIVALFHLLAILSSSSLDILDLSTKTLIPPWDSVSSGINVLEMGKTKVSNGGTHKGRSQKGKNGASPAVCPASSSPPASPLD